MDNEIETQRKIDELVKDQGVDEAHEKQRGEVIPNRAQRRRQTEKHKISKVMIENGHISRYAKILRKERRRLLREMVQ